MPEITEAPIACPYCGESISVLVDDSLTQQSYVEDCQVCCRPIVMDVAVDLDGDVTVSARSEDE
ncbi:MAG: CPXCG motif-containing cysteine-rich protein [Gammaproteobacteria bacterium]|nr:CPXCG motif-containing cysteine-rich protein [Gammaproteobacteria bacterium]MDH5240630.1 CPXCG motif-containing cysteine-rich protein [Gammaproteobacteria bacterium]MDH5262659.1 CPXCG motif-containing cysteine-rich protein [Gammaproteobacteria bacterium]MDH5582833.1 CPXCG motif-containing cysteine-rich protein [Gammaproteobacteria bacterium]